MKRKDSNWVGILSDQGEAATEPNLSEYTLHKRSTQITRRIVHAGIKRLANTINRILAKKLLSKLSLTDGVPKLSKWSAHI